MNTSIFDPAAFLVELLGARLAAPAREWTEQAAAEVAAGTDSERFGALLSIASRNVPTSALAPSAQERAGADQGVAGWNPERWDLRETARVRLVLARADLAEQACERDLEDAFRFAPASIRRRPTGLSPPEIQRLRAVSGAALAVNQVQRAPFARPSIGRAGRPLAITKWHPSRSPHQGW